MADTALPPKIPGRSSKPGQQQRNMIKGGGGGHNAVEEKLLDLHASSKGGAAGTQQGTSGDSMPMTLMYDQVSPATRLLEKRRQMFEVQEALNSQKDEFARREDAFRRREDGLRRKDLELQETLIKFNKFLQENESKRNRALKRAAEERKQREAKEAEIKRLEAELLGRLKEETQLKDMVERNIQYQDYLESVCQSMAKYFPEISDILNRYKTLVDANADLLKKQQQIESTNETTQREYFDFKKDGENRELNQNNEIAELQSLLESKRKAVDLLQTRIDAVQQGSGDKALTLGQILSSVNNTLNRCEEAYRIRHNKPLADRSADKEAHLALRERYEQVVAPSGKLEDMRTFICDLLDVKAEYAAWTKAQHSKDDGKWGGGGGGGSSTGGGLLSGSQTDTSLFASQSIMQSSANLGGSTSRVMD